MVENAGDHGIHHVEDGFGAVIEGGNGRNDVGTGFKDRDDVPRLDEVPGRFAGNEDQAALFLQKDVGGTDDGAVRIAMGDPANGSHRAGNDDHGVKFGRTADKRHLHRGVSVDLETLRDGHLADLGLGDLCGMGTQGDMDFMRALGIFRQKLKQSLGIEGTACPGDGHNKFHDSDDTCKRLINKELEVLK